MKRRDFLTVAGAAGVTSAVLGATAGAAEAPGIERAKQYIELLTFTVADLDKKALLIETLDNALIPALNRQRVRPVGVFYTNATINGGNADFDLNVFVLAGYNSSEAFRSSKDNLLTDEEYLRAAAPILEATSRNPVYTALKSSLFYGFDECPAIEVPTLAPSRVLQLRIYRSFNLERNAAKVHMFDVGGELPLFRKVNMHPVFFGTALAGDQMPNLSFILSFEDNEARLAAWDAFRTSPEWEAMKDLPMYADTATEITNVLLKPSKGSQI